MCLPLPPPVRPISVSRASPGAVDHAAQHRKDIGVVMWASRFSSIHRADHVEALPRARRARHDPHAAGAQAERLQDVIADLHLLFRIGGERDADRVADAGPQQHAKADGGLDRAADQAAGFGDAQVQRAIDHFGRPL
jgi:hypothetical protein